MNISTIMGKSLLYNLIHTYVNLNKFLKSDTVLYSNTLLSDKSMHLFHCSVSITYCPTYVVTKLLTDLTAEYDIYYYTTVIIAVSRPRINGVLELD